MNLLEVSAPSIGYAPGATVLRDMRLCVEPGESVAILGGNGAGKTLLLRWIAGLLPRNGGQCVIDGRGVGTTRDAVSVGVGLVVQDPDDQLLGATVLEDAQIGPRNQGLRPAQVTARAQAALAAVGLETLGAREIETLSLGERKRASLAGVLAMQPKLLLLDEPTAGLDPHGEISLCNTLNELRRSGVTLLVATHAVDLVPSFATRVLLLAEGRVLADGACRDVLVQEELLARACVRRPWPVELWSRTGALHDSTHAPPMTMEEMSQCLTRAYC